MNALGERGKPGLFKVIAIDVPHKFFVNSIDMWGKPVVCLFFAIGMVYSVEEVPPSQNETSEILPMDTAILETPPGALPTIFEPVGRVRVNETISISLVATHLKIWYEDMSTYQTSGVQSKMLNYAYTSRSLKYQYLWKAVPEQVPWRGTGRTRAARVKRSNTNFIGNMLNSLTGLATEDQLDRIVSLDQDMRRQMVESMRISTVYREDVAKGAYHVVFVMLVKSKKLL